MQIEEFVYTHKAYDNQQFGIHNTTKHVSLTYPTHESKWRNNVRFMHGNRKH